MTDDATNGAAQAEAERLLQMQAQLVADQTRELLGLLGYAVTDIPGLLAGATMQLRAQAQLSAQIPPSFAAEHVRENPLFGVEFVPAQASSIILANQPPAQGFRIMGPKRVNLDIPPAAIVGSLTALAFATNPVLRLACIALGLRVNFQQVKPAAPKAAIFKGPARNH